MSMQKYPFIFSDERKYRIRRHVAFWTFWWLFQGILYSFVAMNLSRNYWLRLPSSIMESLVFMVAHIFLAYSLMYFVIPRFLLKQRYWLTAFWVIACFLMTAGLSTIFAATIIKDIRIWIMKDTYDGGRTYGINVFLGLMAGLRGGITIGGIAAAIKLMKYWYVKEQRNLQLQKENVEAQLQLLKAQVHPHFLFNTLNNIYSYTQNTAPVAARLVTDLSGMLRYILYECNQPLVPLEKELKMIEDYINLEKIRYGNTLDYHIELPSNTDEYMIAPLLLLPLIENCFKHGTSNMLDQPWLSLQASIEDDWMMAKLMNGKEPVNKAGVPGGIGIQNVKKRLDLLYEGKYEFTTVDQEEVYIVRLKLKLEKKKEAPLKLSALLQQNEHA
ncbi:MAG: sensor histidine kinase [Chitinophagaceae bacterium]